MIIKAVEALIFDALTQCINFFKTLINALLR